MLPSQNAMLKHLGARTSVKLARTLVTKPSEYGQPHPTSHAHLFQNDDLTPGISATEYESRRRKLMDSLPDNSVVISVAAPIKFFLTATQLLKLIRPSYKYRQASDFWYLTGFEEPDAAVILEKKSCSRGYSMRLFSTGKDLAKEKWDGARTSFAETSRIFNADSSEPISTFGASLKDITNSNVYVDVPPSITRRSTTKSILKYLTGQDGNQVFDAIPAAKRHPLAPELAKLRNVKSKAEQAIMHQAGTISGRAHAKTMRFAEPGKAESALAAHFEYICALNGSQRPAYVPVVASGGNALIIHYTNNNQLLGPDDLVLIDAGCEYNGYASDITRTFPASGKFTPAQRDLYTAVLTVQRRLVTYCFAEANISMQELHRLSVKFLKEELNQIGFQLGGEGDLERVLYPHYLSHPIGIDLHESTFFDRSAPLVEGNVVTIEPGIYVPPTANFPKHFHNMGIRIEDEVLVGKEHPVVFTTSAPKEIDDIEGACQGLLGFEPY